MRKRNLWEMENWPSNKDDLAIKNRIKELERLKEVDRLVDLLADRLHEQCRAKIEEFRREAKEQYPKMLESRDYDVIALKELFVEAYGVDHPNEVMDQVLSWRVNMYQALEELK